jgi:cystathionine beta-lyase
VGGSERSGVLAELEGERGGPIFDFDRGVDRRGSDSLKWNKYAGRDILPLWVADMDFAAPPAVLDALRLRIDHGVFGYGQPWPSLVESVQAHCQR